MVRGRHSILACKDKTSLQLPRVSCTDLMSVQGWQRCMQKGNKLHAKTAHCDQCPMLGRAAARVVLPVHGSLISQGTQFQGKLQLNPINYCCSPAALCLNHSKDACRRMNATLRAVDGQCFTRQLQGPQAAVGILVHAFSDEHPSKSTPSRADEWWLSQASSCLNLNAKTCPQAYWISATMPCCSLIGVAQDSESPQHALVPSDI